MSAPGPVRVLPVSGAMNEREAQEILEHPVFGDERCIQARKVVVLAARVRNRRDSFQRSFVPVHSMTAEELEQELAWWKSWHPEENEEGTMP